jgi:hypothetical protein
MPRALRLITAALIAAVAVLLVACGNSESNGYVSSVNDVTSQLQSDVSEISSGADVSSPQQAATIFTQVSGKVDAAAAKLNAIEPPDQVADLHQKLVQDLQTLGSEAKGAGDDIKAGGAAAAPGVLTHFVAQARQLDTAIKATIDEINAKLGQ